SGRAHYRVDARLWSSWNHDLLWIATRRRARLLRETPNERWTRCGVRSEDRLASGEAAERSRNNLHARARALEGLARSMSCGACRGSLASGPGGLPPDRCVRLRAARRVDSTCVPRPARLFEQCSCGARTLELLHRRQAIIASLVDWQRGAAS